MTPSNSEVIIVRNLRGRYTDTLGLFRIEETKKMELDFIKVLQTNLGPMDEYEIITER